MGAFCALSRWSAGPPLVRDTTVAAGLNAPRHPDRHRPEMVGPRAVADPHLRPDLRPPRMRPGPGDQPRFRRGGGEQHQCAGNRRPVWVSFRPADLRFSERSDAADAAGPHRSAVALAAPRNPGGTRERAQACGAGWERGGASSAGTASAGHGQPARQALRPALGTPPFKERQCQDVPNASGRPARCLLLPGCI